MSELTNDIFHNKKHKLTSVFGKRTVIGTAKGNTSSFHSGADYGTYGEKLSQYAVGEGTVISSGVDADYGNAKYVWVKYPALKVKMLHYHLDSIAVKAGQTVNSKTVLGKTGKTGMATGIHLHLAIKRLSGGDYIDPEKWSKEEYVKLKKALSKSEYKPGNYRVTADVLLVRKGAGLCYASKKFAELTKDARTKIEKLSGRSVNGYVKGLVFTASEIKTADGYTWGKTPSGWVALDYSEAVK